MPDLGGHPLVSTALAIAGKIAGQRRAQQSLFNAIRTNRPELARFRSEAEVLFLAYVFTHRERSRARNLADLWVCWELDDRRDGSFVDIGEDDSATALLEEHYGWSGLAVEPDPRRLADVMGNELAKRGALPETVDYLSINAGLAGPEFAAAYDLQRHPVQLITVAQNKRTAPQVEDVLHRRGYRRVFDQFSGFDGWYVAADRLSRSTLTN